MKTILNLLKDKPRLYRIVAESDTPAGAAEIAMKLADGESFVFGKPFKMVATAAPSTAGDGQEHHPLFLRRLPCLFEFSGTEGGKYKQKHLHYYKTRSTKKVGLFLL